MGIDPGTAITGYGLVDYDDELRLVDCGAILTQPGTALPQRLVAIHRKLSDLILQFHPQAVAVEELFFSKNVRTAMSVGQARGTTISRPKSSRLWPAMAAPARRRCRRWCGYCWVWTPC